MIDITDERQLNVTRKYLPDWQVFMVKQTELETSNFQDLLSIDLLADNSYLYAFYTCGLSEQCVA